MKISSMRVLALLLVSSALLLGAYVFYLKKLPTTDSGTAATQAISLTGVRSDLLQIAQAERAYVASNGSCASLPDLISSNIVGDDQDASATATVTPWNAPVRNSMPLRGTRLRPPARPFATPIWPSIRICRFTK